MGMSERAMTRPYRPPAIARSGPPRVAGVHAVVIRDNRLHWEERDDPAPGDTELLVAVRAAGLNSADLVQRAGFYPAPAGSPPDIPGMELAGEVVGVGRQVTLFAPGDRVMALVGGGAQATLAVVDETHALAAPGSLPWPEAGGFPEVFTTAFDALFTQAGLQMGERVLVSGAAGGVGTAAVQLAAAAGATVTASVRDPDRWEAVAALGAATVIAPGSEGEHGPYDVLLELVGAPSLSAVLPHLATWARVVVIGVGGGSSDGAGSLAAHGEEGPDRILDAARPEPAREGRRGGGRGRARAPAPQLGPHHRSRVRHLSPGPGRSRLRAIQPGRQARQGGARHLMPR